MSGSTPLYPVNLKIAGRLCLVVGGGPVAVRKVEALLVGGGKVLVVSPEAAALLRRLAQAGTIEWRQRPYRAGDLDGAFIVIAATNRPEVQRQVARDAAAGRVLLNSTDDPSACDFQVPSQLKRWRSADYGFHRWCEPGIFQADQGEPRCPIRLGIRGDRRSPGPAENAGDGRWR